MKAIKGKIIVRFLSEPKREVLLPEGSDPVPIEAIIVSDATGAFATGQRVIVSRMGGTSWGKDNPTATIEPKDVLFVRFQGKAFPAPGMVLVHNQKLGSPLELPQDTVNDMTRRGNVVLCGDKVEDLLTGTVVHYEPHNAVQVRMNGRMLHLVPVSRIYAMEEAA